MLRYYRNIFNISKNKFRNFSRSFAKNAENLPNLEKINYEPSELAKSFVSIEKKSLSRGMTLNMFEKVT